MGTILKFKIGEEEYYSKPFDFEAMCIINDAHNDATKKGTLSICRDAMDYLFEGITDNLRTSSVEEQTRLCLELWKIYVRVLNTTERRYNNGKTI